jgi:hypothetical protein
VVLAVVAVRVRLSAMPLERDEGEYAYMGQLILEGVPPYQIAGNMKLPGVYLAYAGIMAIFGQTSSGIHLGLLTLNLASLAVLLAIARRFLDLGGAVIAVVACGLLTLNPAYLGLAAHATHFVMFFALLGLWCLLRVERSGAIAGCFAAGLCFGAAFLMKQPGLFFGIFGGAYLLWFSLAAKVPRRRLAARLALYAAGIILPWALVCLWMAWTGTFSKFWYWTVTYTAQYGSSIPIALGLHFGVLEFLEKIKATPAIWGLAAVGLFWLCRAGWRERIFFGGFFLAGALAVCPGWYFREHYFIQLLPAGALLAGLAVTRSGAWLADRTGGQAAPLLFLLAAIACALCLVGPAEPLFFTWSPTTASRAIYRANPFPESPVIAKYLAEHTRPDQRIAVLGDEPQIYFYAHRRSASSRLYPSQLMDPRPYTGALQEDFIREIEAASVPYVVWVTVRASWSPGPKANTHVFDWAVQYLSKNYRPVGAARIASLDQTVWTWGDAATNQPMNLANALTIYERITNRVPPRP